MSVFRERRVFDEQTGWPRYLSLETVPVATGVALVDAWLRWLATADVLAKNIRYNR